jgi:type IV pilus biogenesis protein CpaD/CtpE
MKIVVQSVLLVVLATTLSGCKFQPQYECTITDARTGQVIKKVKVNYKSECDTLARLS